MLDVGREVVCRKAYPGGEVRRDGLASLLEACTYIGHPVGSRNFLEEHKVSELEEGHTLVVEKVLEEVFFAAEEAEGGILLMLPDRAETLLEGGAIGEVANLLELVDADYDMDLFLEGDTLGQLEDVGSRVVVRIPVERE